MLPDQGILLRGNLENMVAHRVDANEITIEEMQSQEAHRMSVEGRRLCSWSRMSIAQGTSTGVGYHRNGIVAVVFILPTGIRLPGDCIQDFSRSAPASAILPMTVRS